VTPTGHNAKSTITPTIGPRARLSGVLRRKGTGAPIASLVLAGTLATLLIAASAASAALTHEYLPVPSEALSKGVPPGCVLSPPPLKEPPCISGALTGAWSIAPNGAGSVWVADSTSKGARVDKFNDKTGAFVGPQLVEEGGVTGLEAGTGAGVAVGHAFSSEQVYVQAKQGVAVYDGETGTLAGTWSGAHTPGGGFAISEQRLLRGVAVDDSASSQAKGDVYVPTQSQYRFGSSPGTAGTTEPLFPEFNVVDVFDPEGGKAGVEPAAPVAEIKGTCANENEDLPCAGGGGVIPFKFPYGVAVSPVSGEVFVEDCPTVEFNYRCVVDVFKPEGMGLYSFVRSITEANKTPFAFLAGVAVDGNGDIYIAQGSFGGRNVVDQYSPEGEYLGRLRGTPSGLFPDVQSVGVDNGNVFVAGGESVPLSVFGPSVVIPDVEVTPTEPSEIHETSVTLNGTVKLDKAGSAECFFEYGTSRSYGTTVACEPNPATEAQEVAGKVAVKKTIGLAPEEELRPDTTYFYRVRALNNNSAHIASTGEGAEDEGEVTTSGPGLDGESASEVDATAAHLDASIDPNGLPTSYYFQYNTTGTGVCEPKPEAAGCTSVPVAPEEIGSTATPGGIGVSQRIQGLAQNTTYHYRVIVLSEPEPGVTKTFPEPDQTFTTQPPGSGFALPDGREWELVSPVDKHGADLRSGNGEWVTEASLSGDAFTGVAGSPTEEGARGYSGIEQVLYTRGAGGWSERDISLAHHTPSPPHIGKGEDYRFFSEDLSLAVAEPFGEYTSLKPDVFPPDSERTPYVRHDLTCQATPSTCFQPLVTGAPGYADVPGGTSFGGSSGVEQGPVEFAGATPDLSHVVVNSGVGLKSGLGGGLYEWSAGKPFGEEELAPVSVLPAAEGGGMEGEGATRLGGGQGDARWAVSADGSRVVWTSSGGGLYLRDMADEQSVRLGGGNAEFQIANSEDSRVFFTDVTPLVSGAGVNDLYECEIVVEAAGPRCVLHDVAPGASLLGGSVPGASEDGSYVYFASNAVLGDGTQRGAVPGTCGGFVKSVGHTQKETEEEDRESCNLYMVHYDSASRAWEAPVFIAMLSGADSNYFTHQALRETPRVSPNGQWLAFMSDRSLTGYDNEDVTSKSARERLDQEVFLYNAETHKLACASCDPTGARPAGIEIEEFGGGRLIGNLSGAPREWVAASLPEWDEFSQLQTLYQPRYLSDEGRLFFNSSDALVPQDVNHNEDVYEYEPAGTPAGEHACSPSAASGGEVFKAQREAAPGVTEGAGCVGLISSGTSAKESAFLDASANGKDVFFLTAEKLVPADIDNAYDIYDAHVCGAEGVPCTAQPVAPPECTTADACRAAPPAQPGVFGAPPSATFNGPGDLAPSLPAKLTKKKTVKCSKGKKRDKRGRCVKQKKSTKASAKRASNDRRSK
jgi:hypothetical protein